MNFRGMSATLNPMKKSLLGVLVAAAVVLVATFSATVPSALQTAYADEARLSYVTDAAGLLTDEEVYALETQGRAIESTYGVGAYVVTVSDYRRIADGDMYDVARAVYLEYALGVGEGKDGVLLFLFMNERDYSFIAYGDTATRVLDDAARATVADCFLDDLSRNDWYGGFADFFTQVDLCLECDVAGVPYVGSGASDAPYGGDYGYDYDEGYDDRDYYYEDYDDDYYYPGGSGYVDTEDLLKTLGVFAIGVLVVPFIIMLIVIAVLDGKMKSVAPATHAAEYVVGNLELSNRSDRYTHTTETVVQVESDDDGPSIGGHGGFGGGGFGGGGFGGGGGFRGGGGKF